MAGGFLSEDQQMNISANIHNIAGAECFTLTASPDRAFDLVKVKAFGGGEIAMFLPAGTGQAMADAISAAVVTEVAA